MIHLIIYSENIAPLLAPCHKPSYRGLRSLRSLTRGYEWSRPVGGFVAPLRAPCHKPSYRGLRSLRSLTRGYEWSRPAGGLRRLQWLLMDTPYGGLFQSSFLNTIALKKGISRYYINFLKNRKNIK